MRLWIIICEPSLNSLAVGEQSKGTLGRSPECAAFRKALGRGAGEEEPCQVSPEIFSTTAREIH